MTSARLCDLRRMQGRFIGTVTWQRRSDRGGRSRPCRIPPQPQSGNIGIGVAVMGLFSASHFPRPKALAACGAIAIGSACFPSVAFAQNVVTDILSVPFAIVEAPFVAADAVIADPYYRHPAYGY